MRQEPQLITALKKAYYKRESQQVMRREIKWTLGSILKRI